MAQMLYDVFISHASEDKDTFVRPLARMLQSQHIEVWYDELSLTLGDSLRQSIDKGLSRSRYGIVVISPAFISKEWPQWELDGLVARQLDEKRKLILPIWHDVTRKQVLDFCPPLVDKVAVASVLGLEAVVDELLKVLKPRGSTLVIARDRLMELGIDSPVVTDDWWLDIVEFSGSNDVEGTWQEPMGWGHWGFPLPSRSDDPVERGERLAWAAAQKRWQQNAAEERISQVTHPNEVWAFIESQPGLLDTCLDYPNYAIAYASQLCIPGFGGPLEDIIERSYEQSLYEQQRKRADNDRSGTALTTNGLAPACDESVVFRHPTLGDYDPGHLACWFVQGHMFGPEVKVYEVIDYAIWLLSSKSQWMPEHIRNALIAGMADWGVWLWHQHYDSDHYGYSEYRPGESCGALFDALTSALDSGHANADVILTEPALSDMAERFAYSCELFGLPESSNTLIQRFINAGFIETWIHSQTHKTSP